MSNYETEYENEIHSRVLALERDMRMLSHKVDSSAGKLDEVLDLLRASKMFTKLIGWLGAAGVALITAWATFKGVR